MLPQTFFVRRDSGFTLLEILLVLLLVSLASVAVISTLPNRAEDNAKKYAQALFHRVQLLNEEAMLSGRDYGLHINEKKALYDLMYLDSKGWQRLDKQDMPGQTKLPDNISVVLTLGGDVWGNKERLFNPTSLFDEEMFAELEKEKVLPPPQIFIVSSGEVTPFSLSIHSQGKSEPVDAWRVVAKENGQIILLKPGEVDEQAK